MYKNAVIFFLVSLIVIFVPSPINASGYFIRLQSASGLGNCFAGGNTGAHDLSDMFFNPAAIFQPGGRQGCLPFTMLVPDSKFTFKNASNILGQAITGDPGGSNIIPQALIPSAYAAIPLKNGEMVGFAVNVPFGLKTENPAAWVGRYHALNSDLKTLNIAAIWGKKLGERTFAAVGWQNQGIDAALDNAIDFGTIGVVASVPGAIPGKQDGYAKISGDDNANGFLLGFIHEFNSRNKIGLSFRSQIHHKIKGIGEFQLDSAGIGKTLNVVTKAFQRTDLSTDLVTPSIFGFGYQNKLSDSCTLLFDASRINWSEFRELRIKFANTAQADSVTAENWRDTWFYTLGFVWKADERLTWKLGMATDQGPVGDQYRVPRLPAAENRWYSLGFSWKASKDSTVDLSLARLNYSNAPIHLSTADAGNTFRGNLNGNFKTTANIVGLSLNSRF